MQKNNLINDWLDQHGDPEITKLILRKMSDWQRVIDACTDNGLEAPKDLYEVHERIEELADRIPPNSDILFRMFKLLAILDKHFGDKQLSTEEKIYYNRHSDEVCSFVSKIHNTINGARLRKFTLGDED